MTSPSLPQDILHGIAVLWPMSWLGVSRHFRRIARSAIIKYPAYFAPFDSSWFRRFAMRCSDRVILAAVVKDLLPTIVGTEFCTCNPPPPLSSEMCRGLFCNFPYTAKPNIVSTTTRILCHFYSLALHHRNFAVLDLLLDEKQTLGIPYILRILLTSHEWVHNGEDWCVKHDSRCERALYHPGIARILRGCRLDYCKSSWCNTREFLRIVMQRASDLDKLQLQMMWHSLCLCVKRDADLNAAVFKTYMPKKAPTTSSFDAWCSTM